jgi:hypothetical protein
LESEVRFWNEQYLLEALLSHNRTWKIIGALNSLHHNCYDNLKSVAPFLSPEREPGSFYIQQIDGLFATAQVRPAWPSTTTDLSVLGLAADAGTPMGRGALRSRANAIRTARKAYARGRPGTCFDSATFSGNYTFEIPCDRTWQLFICGGYDVSGSPDH